MNQQEIEKKEEKKEEERKRRRYLQGFYGFANAILRGRR